MKNEINVGHTRYYLFRHINGEQIQYNCGLENNDSFWTSDFTEAWLTKNKESLVDEFKYDVDYNGGSPYTYVIGQVKVEVDGQFPMEVLV